jgi:lysophospholipase L1-like esterase
MRHILFGDSIGFGVGDYENGGWATQLRLFIDRQNKAKDHNLTNLSVSGDTTRGLLVRMVTEAKIRMRTDHPSEFTFLLAIGTNDSKLNKAEPEVNISLEEFENNMNKLIDQASQLSSEVILIGLVPVDETRTAPYKESKYYLVDRMEQYNQVLANLAEKRKLRFVNFFPTWKGLDLPSLFADGLHPNTEGHSLMFETIKRELF